MIKYAITGGIASGKTTALSLFKHLGIKTINTDMLVKNLMLNKAIQRKILNKYPNIKTSSNDLDRKKLSNLAFENPNLLDFLEKIFHPKLDKIRKHQIQKANRNHFKGICFEVPLLFEKKLEKKFDVVVVTFCSKQIQAQRALSRENISKIKLKQILDKQTKDTERIKKAHFIINTGIGKNYTISRIKNILNKTLIKNA